MSLLTAHELSFRCCKKKRDSSIERKPSTQNRRLFNHLFTSHCYILLTRHSFEIDKLNNKKIRSLAREKWGSQSQEIRTVEMVLHFLFFASFLLKWYLFFFIFSNFEELSSTYSKIY